MGNKNAGVFRRKIGNTVYRVSVSYSATSKEGLNDKILRLAKNDLTRSETVGKIDSPQTGRLLGGSM